MKKILLTLALFTASTPAMAEPLAYPGDAWVNLASPTTTNKNNPEAGNWTLQGKITQGVDWVTFGEDDDWTLNTYATVGFSLDTKGMDYNNRVTPGVGVKVRKQIKNGVFDIGVQVINETRFGNKYIIPDRSSNAIQGYVSFWSGWGK
jgi:hypothetical protein